MKFSHFSTRTSSFHWLALLIAVAGSDRALAHPGHGHTVMIAPESFSHWLIEPDHLIGWLAVGLTLGALHRWREQSRQRNTMAVRARTNVQNS